MIISIIVSLGLIGFLLSQETALSVWALSFGLMTLGLMKFTSAYVLITLSSITFLILGLLSVKWIRRTLLSQFIFNQMKRVMPSMSSTEREALEAGTVGFEAKLFSGRPDFNQLRQAPVVHLSAEEQAFIDGPVNELCRLLDDWDITHRLTDLPQPIWQFIKKNRFFGMIIPKVYGGLEFSATAQMIILVKIYGCSITAATTISVPNSLGPGELLLKYGTEAQKNHYLPRLADGREIPCFALTGPNAGSDAASIPDTGIVCEELVEGKKTIGIRLNWDKRYITLSPVATVIGLAFRLYDPEGLIGATRDYGITCALIPRETKGVVVGRRHFPLNTAFMNGPIQGHDVFLPLDGIIGGQAMAGHGWHMLMECLSAGRAISLPSSALGGAQAGAMSSGAYARVRKQFNQSIHQFEGIEEPLARIGGLTYMIDAALTMTAAAIDHGAKPSVAGAILKYHTTEKARKIALDAMDIHGGKGICLGPNNYLGRAYQSTPISITVEGANILTRSLIIFGQGAVRCHPYVFSTLESVRNNDLKAFDTSFWGHVGFILANSVLSKVHSLTNGHLISAPDSRVKRYYQLVHRYSLNLAILSDISMALLGGDLKRKEKLSGRLGDLLSSLYFASAVLKRYHDEGEPIEDLPLVEWACEQLFYECTAAIKGIIHNFPSRLGRLLMRATVQPWTFTSKKPSDKLGQRVAKILTTPSETRTRLTRFVFSEPTEHCPLGRLEAAFHLITAVEPLEKRVMKAVKAGQLTRLTFLEQIEEAKSAGVLTEAEAMDLTAAELARQAVIAVDDFSMADLSRVAIKSEKTASPVSVSHP